MNGNHSIHELNMILCQTILSLIIHFRPVPAPSMMGIYPGLV